MKIFFVVRFFFLQVDKASMYTTGMVKFTTAKLATKGPFTGHVGTCSFTREFAFKSQFN